MKLCIMVIGLLFFSEVGFAKSYKIAGGKVAFNTTGSPSFINIDGLGGHMDGNLKEVKGKFSGDFSCKLADFDTGISLRNKHMKEKYLEVDKFPTAEFKFKDQKDSGQIEGEMKIKKDSHKMVFSYEKKDGVISAKGSFNVKDYPSIGVPSYLGITVANRVDITISFPFKP